MVVLQDIDVTRALAADKGKQLASSSEFHFFKPNKHQVVFYDDDDDSRHLFEEFTNERASTVSCRQFLYEYSERTKGSIHETGTRSWSRVDRSYSRNREKSGSFSLS